MNIDRKQLKALGWSDNLINEVLRQGNALEAELPELGRSPVQSEQEHQSDASSSVHVFAYLNATSSHVVVPQ
jgi:hypothetical protein